MITIGVDPHTRTSHRYRDRRRDPPSGATSQVTSTLAGYRQLLRWCQRFPDRKWAVEGARGLGRHLSQWLLAPGETVVDVSSTATARVRELSRGGRRKNDVIDAAAVHRRQ